MSVASHLHKHPHARGTTIAQKQREEAKTAQLRKEVADMSSRPRSEGAVRRMMRGIAELMARIG